MVSILVSISLALISLTVAVGASYWFYKKKINKIFKELDKADLKKGNTIEKEVSNGRTDSEYKRLRRAISEAGLSGTNPEDIISGGNQRSSPATVNNPRTTEPIENRRNIQTIDNSFSEQHRRDSKARVKFDFD